MEAKTERELLILLEQRIGQLSESIKVLGEGLKFMEEKKISVLQKEIDDIKQWRAQISGGWRIALLFWTMVSATIAGLMVLLVKSIFKW